MWLMIRWRASLKIEQSEPEESFAIGASIRRGSPNSSCFAPSTRSLSSRPDIWVVIVSLGLELFRLRSKVKVRTRVKTCLSRKNYAILVHATPAHRPRVSCIAACPLSRSIRICAHAVTLRRQTLSTQPRMRVLRHKAAVVGV